MTIYHAVKLTRLDNDGNPNPRRRTFGLIESLMTNNIGKGESHRTEHYLEITDISPKKLGMIYAGNARTNFSETGFSNTSLSFKAPCDLIIANLKRVKIYRVENLPTELHTEFQKGILEELLEGVKYHIR